MLLLALSQVHPLHQDPVTPTLMPYGAFLKVRKRERCPQELILCRLGKVSCSSWLTEKKSQDVCFEELENSSTDSIRDWCERKITGLGGCGIGKNS